MENGGHFYDVLDRYDRLTAYVLSREDATAGSCCKWCVPFLKAYGATDHLIHQNSRKNLRMMPNADRTMRYISNLMPAYINTSVFEHGMMEILDRLGAPLCQISDTKLCVDQSMMGRSEARKLRELAAEIATLRIPDTFYELNVPTELKDEDVTIIRTLDSVLPGKVSSLGAMGLMESVDPMTSHKKAYRMLDIRRLTAIDLDSTMYVGSASTDFQPLDLVRDGNGLSVSFNGEEFAVRGSNVAVLSEDTTVASVFASVFFDKGTVNATLMAENWSRDYLRKMDFPDQALLDSFLRENPDGLPEVHLVTEKNVDEVSKRSDAFRRTAVCRPCVGSGAVPRRVLRPAVADQLQLPVRRCGKTRAEAGEARGGHDGLRGDLLLPAYDNVPVLHYVIQEPVEVSGLGYCEDMPDLMQEMAVGPAREAYAVILGMLPCLQILAAEHPAADDLISIQSFCDIGIQHAAVDGLLHAFDRCQISERMRRRYDAVDILQGIEDPFGALVYGQPGAGRGVRLDILGPILGHLVETVEIRQDMRPVPGADLYPGDKESAVILVQLHCPERTADEVMVRDGQTDVPLLCERQCILHGRERIGTVGVEVHIGAQHVGLPDPIHIRSLEPDPAIL